MARRFVLLAAAAAGGALSVLMDPASALAPRVRATARPVDLSARLTITDETCSFSPVVDRALEGMVSQEGSGRPAARWVTIGPMRLLPVVTYHPQTSREYADWSARAEARLTGPAVWNGLRVRGLVVEMAHEAYSAGMIFDARPQAVRSVLARQGINVPLPPESLDLPVEACAASMQLYAVPGGGTALTCSSGC